MPDASARPRRAAIARRSPMVFSDPLALSSPRSTLDDRLPHHQPSTRPRRTELAARHNRYGVEPFEERPQTMPPAWLARPQMETEHGAAARNAMRRQDEARGMRLL